MTHLMDMDVSVQGWNVEPQLLSDIAIEIFHSKMFGDTLRIKLFFGNGSEALIEGDLKEGAGRDVYDAIQREISVRRT